MLREGERVTAFPGAIGIKVTIAMMTNAGSKIKKKM